MEHQYCGKGLISYLDLKGFHGHPYYSSSARCGTDSGTPGGWGGQIPSESPPAPVLAGTSAFAGASKSSARIASGALYRSEARWQMDRAEKPVARDL